MDAAELYITLFGEQPVGYVQRYPFADNPYYPDEIAPLLAAPGAVLLIDYFIGEPDLLRQGPGSAMTRAAFANIWRDYPLAPSVIGPASAANPASGRVLERAGLARAAEGPRTPDNSIDDPHHFIYEIERPTADR